MKMKVERGLLEGGVTENEAGLMRRRCGRGGSARVTQGMGRRGEGRTVSSSCCKLLWRRLKGSGGMSVCASGRAASLRVLGRAVREAVLLFGSSDKSQ